MKTLSKEFLTQKLTSFNGTEVLHHESAEESLEVYKWLITFLDTADIDTDFEVVLAKVLIDKLYNLNEEGFDISEHESILLINSIKGGLKSNYILGSLIEQIQINE